MLGLWGLYVPQTTNWTLHQSPDNAFTFKLPPPWQTFGIQRREVKSLLAATGLDVSLDYLREIVSGPILNQFGTNFKGHMIAVDLNEKSVEKRQFDSLTVFSWPTPPGKSESLSGRKPAFLNEKWMITALNGYSGLGASRISVNLVIAILRKPDREFFFVFGLDPASPKGQLEFVKSFTSTVILRPVPLQKRKKSIHLPWGMSVPPIR